MEKKFFGKFNIIDMIIFGVILLSLFALVFRMVSGSDEDKGVYAVTYICEEAKSFFGKLKRVSFVPMVIRVPSLGKYPIYLLFLQTKTQSL